MDKIDSRIILYNFYNFDVDEFDQKLYNLLTNEMNYILSIYKPCDTKIDINYDTKIDINYTNITKYLVFNFNNYKQMKNISCILNTIENEGNIHKILTNLELLLKSNNGWIYQSGIGGNSKYIMIVKTLDKKEATLESFVGLFGTNLMRQYIPNFSYIFNQFECSHPNVLENGSIEWCKTNKPKSNVGYIVYEKILGSSIKESIKDKNLSPFNFVSFILQILFSLETAYKLIDFTHYDLHSDNIILRPTNMLNFQLKYEQGYIKTNRIATFIDYGLSHIKYKNKSYGNPQYEIYGIKYDKSFPISDIYKLLLSSADNCVKYKNDIILLIIKQLYKYFSDEDILVSIKEQLKTFYILPKIQETEQFTLNGFFDHLKSLFDLSNIYSTSSFNIKEFSCNFFDDCKSNIEQLLESPSILNIINYYYDNINKELNQITTNSFKEFDLINKELNNLSIHLMSMDQVRFDEKTQVKNLVIKLYDIIGIHKNIQSEIKDNYFIETIKLLQDIVNFLKIEL